MAAGDAAGVAAGVAVAEAAGDGLAPGAVAVDFFARAIAVKGRVQASVATQAVVRNAGEYFMFCFFVRAQRPVPIDGEPARVLHGFALVRRERQSESPVTFAHAGSALPGLV